MQNTLKFIAVDGVHVHAIHAVRIGRMQVIGKKWDDSKKDFVSTGEADSVFVSGERYFEDISHYRKICKQGALVPADDNTLTALGL